MVLVQLYIPAISYKCGSGGEKNQTNITVSETNILRKLSPIPRETSRMGYHPRIETPDLATFVTTRTRNSELWFTNNRPVEKFALGLLAKLCERYKVKLYAFALEGSSQNTPNTTRFQTPITFVILLHYLEAPDSVLSSQCGYPLTPQYAPDSYQTAFDGEQNQ